MDKLYKDHWVKETNIANKKQELIDEEKKTIPFAPRISKLPSYITRKSTQDKLEEEAELSDDIDREKVVRNAEEVGFEGSSTTSQNEQIDLPSSHVSSNEMIELPIEVHYSESKTPNGN